MRTACILLLVIIAPFAVKGQGKYLGAADDTKRHAEQIADLIVKSDYSKMAMFTSMIWHGTVPDLNTLNQSTQQKMSQYASMYGNVIDRDYISVQKFGPSLLRHVILLRFERQPVRMKVVYYQSVKGYILLDLVLDTGASKILDEDGVEQKTPPQLPVLPGMTMPGK